MERCPAPTTLAARRIYRTVFAVLLKQYGLVSLAVDASRALAGAASTSSTEAATLTNVSSPALQYLHSLWETAASIGTWLSERHAAEMKAVTKKPQRKRAPRHGHHVQYEVVAPWAPVPTEHVAAVVAVPAAPGGWWAGAVRMNLATNNADLDLVDEKEDRLPGLNVALSDDSDSDESEQSVDDAENVPIDGHQVWFFFLST